jgi:hypothetical protein
MDQYGQPIAGASGGHDLDLADDDLRHVLVLGSAFGIALFYPLATLIGLASTSLGEALVLAIVPAIVAGPFVGSVLALGLRLTRLEHEADVIAVPTASGKPQSRKAA